MALRYVCSPPLRTVLGCRGTTTTAAARRRRTYSSWGIGPTLTCAGIDGYPSTSGRLVAMVAGTGTPRSASIRVM